MTVGDFLKQMIMAPQYNDEIIIVQENDEVYQPFQITGYVHDCVHEKLYIHVEPVSES